MPDTTTNTFILIANAYSQDPSIPRVAKQLKLSQDKIRRTLITLGLWSSPRSRDIVELHNQHYTTEEIAKKLNLSIKAVQSYLPYERGMYQEIEPSNDSVRSKLYRERIKTASKNTLKTNYTTLIFPKNISYTDNNDNDKLTGAIHLRLKMQLPELDAKQWDILHKYGKVEKGITRDILVPSNMRLYALFFAIQKSFGLLNEHLHYFSLPGEVFNKMTKNGNFKEYCKLCGQYFRFPTEDFEDLYWYCDYNENISIKNWFKKKYTGPYIYKGQGDYYSNCQKDVAKFIASHPEIGDTATLIDLRNANIFLPNTNSLLERLPLKCIITSNPNNIDWQNWQQATDNPKESLFVVNPIPITNYINYTYDDIWDIKITCIKEYKKVYSEDDWQLDKFYYIDKDNNIVDETALHMLIKTVETNHAPICIAKDGIEVVEDIGGVYGFIEFLDDIYNNKDKNKIKELRAWARSLSWTGRTVQEKNTL